MLDEQHSFPSEGDSCAFNPATLLVLLVLVVFAGFFCRWSWVVLSTLLGFIRNSMKPVSPVSPVPLFGLLLLLWLLGWASNSLETVLFFVPLVSLLAVAWCMVISFRNDCPFTSTFDDFDDSATDKVRYLRNETSSLRKCFNEYTAILADKVRVMGREIHAKEVAFDHLRRANAKTVADLKRDLALARKQVKDEKKVAALATRQRDWERMGVSGLKARLAQTERSLDALRAGRPHEMDEDLLARLADKQVFFERLALKDLTDAQKREIRDLKRLVAAATGTSNLARHITEKIAAQEEVSFLTRQYAALSILYDQSASDGLLHLAVVNRQRELAESNSRDLEAKLQTLRREMEAVHREMDKSAESHEKDCSRAKDKIDIYKALSERLERERDQLKDWLESAQVQRRDAAAHAKSLQSKIDDLTKELERLRNSCYLFQCPCCPDGCSASSSATATPAPAPVPSPSPSPELALLRQELARLRAENETLRQPAPSPSPSSEVAFLHQELARLRGENDSLRQQTATLSQEHNVARGLMGQAEGRWNSLQDAARSLEIDLAAARQEANSATARANELAEQLSRQVAAPAAPPAAPVAVPATAAAPPAAHVAVPATATAAAPPVAFSAELLRQSQQQIEQATKRAEEAEQKLVEALDKLDSANANLENLRNAPGAVPLEERNEWAMERGQLQCQIDGLNTTLWTLRRDVETAEADLEEAEDNLEVTTKSHKATVDGLEDMIQEIKESRDDEIARLEGEIDRLNREIVSIREESDVEAYTDSDEEVVETFDDSQEYE
ncbi:hypothetical protein JOL62DRAFT_605762 [Phyllosticta paracitricarpa]